MEAHRKKKGLILASGILSGRVPWLSTQASLNELVKGCKLPVCESGCNGEWSND